MANIVKNIMMILLSMILFMFLLQTFGWWAIIVPVGIVVLIILIRLGADLYWHGKDKGEW